MGTPIDINPEWVVVEGPGVFKEGYGTQSIYLAQNWGSAIIKAVDGQVWAKS